MKKQKELIALPEWLSSKNDFNEAKRLINDIRADTNNVKPSSNNNFFFNYLDKLINDISNNKKKKMLLKEWQKVYQTLNS